MLMSFKSYMEGRSESATVVASFGRVNPPTIGHWKLLKAMSDIGKKEKADSVQFYGSHSQDAKKNPLDFSTKMKYLGIAAKALNVDIMKTSNVKNPFELVISLAEDGFKHIILVAGSDRIAEYEKAEKYALEAGAESFKVVSAGERDPDAEGAEGMSASKMRKAAAEGDFQSFLVGSGLTKGNAEELYKAVRKGMNIK